MKKRVLTALLTCSLTISTLAAPAVVWAQDFDQQIEQTEKEIQNLQSQQASLQSQITELEGQIASINGEAAVLVEKQQELAADTERLQQEIADLEVRIEKREDAIREQARDVQKNGGDANIVGAVLNAESISDAIGRVQAMTTIVNANNDLVEQQKQDKQAVEDKTAENEEKLNEIRQNQATLEQQKGEIEKAQADLDLAKADLALQQSSKEDEKEGLQQAKAEAEAEAARIAEQERLAKEAQQAAEEAAAQAAAQEQAAAETVVAESTETPARTANNSTGNTQNSSNNGSSTTVTEAPPVTDSTVTEDADLETVIETPVVNVPAPSGTGSAVVAEAYKYIGVPYVWGGKDPSGFDCSGFTSYVYRQATGREIGSWTVPQESAGTVISVSEAQPGDLLFWGSRGGSYHVAISLGGGQYIHAPQPGQSVTTASVSSWAPDFAVRM